MGEIVRSQDYLIKPMSHRLHGPNTDQHDSRIAKFLRNLVGSVSIRVESVLISGWSVLILVDPCWSVLVREGVQKFLGMFKSAVLIRVDVVLQPCFKR